MMRLRDGRVRGKRAAAEQEIHRREGKCAIRILTRLISLSASRNDDDVIAEITSYTQYTEFGDRMRCPGS